MTDEVLEDDKTTYAFIFVGGPFHGKWKLVDDPETVLSLFPPQDLIPPGEIPTPELYIKRAIEVKVRGMGRRRELYVHNGVKNPNELLPLLANALLANYIEEGEEVEDDEPAETTSPLLLPGQ